MKQIHFKRIKRELLRKGFSGAWLNNVTEETLVETYNQERDGFTRIKRPIFEEVKIYESLDLLTTSFFVTRKDIEFATGILVRTQINKEHNHTFTPSDVMLISQFFCTSINDFMKCNYNLFSLVDLYEIFLRSKGRAVVFFSNDGSSDLQNREVILKKIQRQCDVGETKIQILKNQMRLFDEFRAYRDLGMSPSPEVILLLKTSDLFSAHDLFDC